MKTIELTEKEFKAIDSYMEKRKVLDILLEEIGDKLLDNRKKMWEFFQQLYPELEGHEASYNHKTRTIYIKAKEDTP